MERSAYQELKKWKESEWRKPLIINGARQVGKTYLLREFGKAVCAYGMYQSITIAQTTQR